jgi:hypothetical protein
MPREPRAKKPFAVPRDGPVRPGSPMYRLLQMIAREIAEAAPEDRPPTSPDEGPEKK